ncbi:MAG: hypothetical protein GY760_15445 [Deltaproteobacteria bacterium]|nr:hypothetical protein [Deltaproteobacteria bacterium]
MYLDVLTEKYGNDKVVRKKRINKIQEEISGLRDVISQAEDNLFEGKIDSQTFEKGKNRYLQKILDLEFEQTELKNTGSKFMNKVARSLEVFKNL